MLRFSILSWCLLSLLMTSPTQAAFESWTPVGPYGGRVAEVVVVPSDPQVVYAATSVDGVFKSVDGGATWNRASERRGFVTLYGLVVDPGDKNLVFAFGSFGFFRTQDGGATWQPVGGGFSNQLTCSMALAPSAPQIIYASGSSYGTIKSLDGGETWTQISVQSRCSLAVDPANPWILFGSSDEGLERSADGGESWEISQTVPQLERITAAVFHPQDSQTIYFGVSTLGSNPTGDVYRSTDGGQHWESVLQVSTWSLAVAASDPQQVVAGGADGLVFRSADGGEEWEGAVRACTRKNCEIVSLSLDSTNPSRVFAASQGAEGIFASADGGQSFHASNQGLGGEEIAALALSPDGSKLFAQTAPHGILLSEDLGSTWRVVSEEAPAPSFLDARIIFDPQDPSTIYALGGNVYRSIDGGETWNLFYTGSGITDLAIDPRDSKVLYGTLFEGMLKSVDGGNSWVESGPPGLYALAVALDPKDPDVVFVGTREKLHRSPDGGATWEVVSYFPDHTLVTRLAFDPLRPEDFYVVTAGRGFYRGFDDGRVLVQVEEVQSWVRDLVFDPTEPGHLLAATIDGVYEGGSYGFRFLGRDLPRSGTLAVALTPGNPYTVFAGSTGVSRITLAKERCFPSAHLLCLDDQPGDRRFMARLRYDTALGGGLRGTALATSLEDWGVTQGGVFSFFDADNPEALVKVVNGCEINDRYWLFAAAATNVGFTLDVLDMVSGVMETWINPDQNRAAPIVHPRAFASCSVGASNGEGGTLRAPDPSPPVVRATASSEGPCIPDPTTLCIDERFAVRVHFDTALGGGLTGDAEALPLASAGVEDGGVFSFFNPANPEVLVKIVDGCAFNGYFWVFTAATTTLGYELTVEDTDRGEMVMYENVDGTAAETVTDATAFATCDP